jgi:Na+-driven multidrug efflux pump
MALGAFIFNIILNNPSAVAAFQSAGRIEHLFFLPIISISSSMVTLVGMFFGAERFDLLKSIIWYGLKVGIFFSCLSTVFFYFSAQYIIPFFTDSSDIIVIANGYFSIACFSYPFVAIGMTSSRVMQGLGHGKPMLIITLIRVILINAPLGYVITRVLNLPIHYLWYSILISSLVASFISILWMKFVIKLEQNKLSSVT